MVENASPAVVVPSASQEASSSSIPVGDPYAKRRFLMLYKDPEMEAKFQVYLAPHLLRSAAAVYAVMCSIGMVLLVSGGTTWWFWIATTMNSGHAFLWQMGLFVASSRGAKHLTLITIEERIVTLACIFITFCNGLSYYDNLAQDCRYVGTGGNLRHNLQVYNEANCQRYIESSLLIPLALIVLFHRVRFVYAFGSVLILLSSCIIGPIVYPPPRHENRHINIGIFFIYYFFTSVFIAFVRVDHERTQRRQFEVMQDLLEEQRLLEKQQEALYAFCNELVPRSVARLFASRSVTERRAFTTVENGVVMMVGIHDFGVWCTKELPINAAVTLSSIQMSCLQHATSYSLDRIAVNGDLFCAVGNLLRELKDAPLRAVAVADKIVLGLHVVNRGIPDLHGGVAMGELTGGFTGALSVRYSVFGEAWDAAASALRAAKPRQLLITEAVRSACSTYVEGDLLDGSKSGSNTATAPTERKGGTTQVGRRKSQTQHNLGALDPEGLVQRQKSDDSSDLSSGGLSLNPPSYDHEFDDLGTRNLFSVLNVYPPYHLKASSGAVGGAAGEENAVEEEEEEEQEGDAYMRYVRTLLEGISQPSTETSASQPSSMFVKKRLSHSSQRLNLDAVEETTIAVGQETETTACIFRKFDDPTTEEQFKNYRVRDMPTAASKIWLAYAGLLFAVFLLLMLDMHEYRGVHGAILLIITIMFALLLALIPRVVSQQRMDSLFIGWSIAGVVVPVLALFACAVARPSAIGTDVKGLALIGGLVRSYCFPDSRYQAVAVPLMLFISSFHYIMPGGRFRSGDLFLFAAVLATIFVENSREHAQRDHWLNQRRITRVMVQLLEVNRMREQLLKSVLPEKIYLHLTQVRQASSNPLASVNALTAFSVPLTTVMVIDIPSVVQGALVDQAVTAVEQAVAHMMDLGVTSVFGDQATVAGPLITDGSILNTPAFSKESEECFAASMQLAIDLDELGIGLRVMIDHDSTVQVVYASNFTSFTLLGPAVTRLLAIAGGVDPASLGPGVIGTDRVLSLAESGSLTSLKITSTPLGTWRVRGAGIFRLAKIHRAQ